MSLITDYKERIISIHGHKVITYNIGSFLYKETLDPEGMVLVFKCFQDNRCILATHTGANGNFHLTCSVTEIWF